MLITWSFYILCYLTFFYWLALIIGWHKTLYIKLKHSLSFGLKASFSVVRWAQFFLCSSYLSSHFPSYPSIYQVSQCISLPMCTCLSRIYSSILLSHPIHILKHQTLLSHTRTFGSLHVLPWTMKMVKIFDSIINTCKIFWRSINKGF